ncbi:MAG: NADH-quinone oxidoreductase subunit NuoG [Parachlamydiaceae bacterium]
MTAVNLTIDGIPVTVPKGTTVYHAAKQVAINLPIFCYQDRMPPFGACRVCLVEVEKMGKPQTSCTLEATEGMVVHTRSPKAVTERESILEFLLINHPLDCPICDKGGECPLQDQTIEFGPGQSRFFEEKRRFTKALPLGPVLMLDRERCIACARCTRFGDIIAGDHALEFIDRGYRTEVGTPNGGPVESKFIGNTISICPVGALTSQVYRFRARPWDNKHTHSTCTLCPVGCSMTLDARDGEIMRTRACENRGLNDIWLCDKGWFGYEFTDHPDRLDRPLIRRGDKLEPAEWEEALTLVAAKMQAAKPQGKLAGLGGNPLTVEENYLFQQLMRDVAGVNHVDHRVGTPAFSIHEEGVLPGMEMGIGDCEDLTYAVLFGVDLTEEFPVIWLRLKQALNRGAKVIFMGHFSPEIAPHLTQTILHTPGTELESLRQNLPHIASVAAQEKKVAFFVGRQYLETQNRRAILSELTKLRASIPQASLNVLEGKGNSMGARLAGMRPDVGPLGKPVANPGFNTVQVLENAAHDGWQFLYVAGADPAAKVPTQLWKEARAKLGFLVVQDLFLTETARQADVVFPTLSFVEKSGSFITIDRQVQKLHPGKAVPENLLSDGAIFSRIADKLNAPLIIDPEFTDKLQGKRIDPTGQPRSGQGLHVEKSAPAKKTHQDTLAASFAIALFDHGVRMRHNVHLVEVAKAPRARLNPFEAVKRGLKDGDKVSLCANGHTIAAKINVDEKVSLGTIVLPLGFGKIPVHELGTRLLNGMEIEINKVTNL